MSHSIRKPLEVSEHAEVNPPRVPGSAARWIGEYGPTLLVLGLLSCVAVFGHRNDWKLPKFSAIANADAKQPAIAWCGEHGVPESICVECRPNLLPKPKDYGWCKVHGVSQCPICHPEVAQTKQPVEVQPEDRERAQRAFALRPRAENNPKCTLYKRRIQFGSSDVIKKAGIDVEPVQRAGIDELLTVNGEVTFDHTRVAHLSAKSPGTVWRVEYKMGDRIAAGDVLALIDAAEVGRAKGELLEAVAKWEFAVATKDRLGTLAEKAIPGSRLLEAETAVREALARVLRAQQMLVNLGLPVSYRQFQGKSADEIAAELQFTGLPTKLIENLDRSTTTSNLLPIRAPFDGILVDVDVVRDEVVDTTKPLFQLVDTTQMWLTLDVPAEEARYVQVGQLARFRTSSNSQEVRGTIDWISAQSDSQTRTVKVRATLQNTDGSLRDQSFGAGQIILRAENDAIVVPRESLQWDGSCQVVFVRDKDFFSGEDSFKIFYPRPVRVGATTDSTIEILAGVLPGEVVVTKGSGVLRGELLKNNLGAG